MNSCIQQALFNKIIPCNLRNDGNVQLLPSSSNFGIISIFIR